MKKMQIILSALPDSVYYISNKKSIVIFDYLEQEGAKTLYLFTDSSCT